MNNYRVECTKNPGTMVGLMYCPCNLPNEEEIQTDFSQLGIFRWVSLKK